MRRRVRDAGRGLAQRRDVVQHPERSAVRRHRQVVAVERDVAHRRRRQVAAAATASDPRRRTRRRCRSPCRRRADPCRCGILAHGADVRRRAESGGDRRPRPPAIVRPVDVGRQVVELVRIDGDVSRLRVEARRLDQRDLRPFLQPGRRDLRPVSSRRPRVICTSPSSVPIQIRPAWTGDGAIEKMTS